MKNGNRTQVYHVDFSNKLKQRFIRKTFLYVGCVAVLMLFFSISIKQNTQVNALKEEARELRGEIVLVQAVQNEIADMLQFEL
ncbi:hypothetical protein LJC63_12590 [Ruminococcaceae bacterium OttesenSCG-928-L11]|nr:hypothetical protein [Ruminococcaceae bacterium OttesenSCG-928-L11]